MSKRSIATCEARVGCNGKMHLSTTAKVGILKISDRKRRILRRSCVTGCGMLIVGLLASWIVAGRLVAPNNHLVGEPPSDLLVETISLPSQSGTKIAGWHVLAESSRGVVVLLHGYSGSRLSMLDRARWLAVEGYATVLIDLQAHGESRGTHITIGHLEKHDVVAAVEYAKSQHPDLPVGVLGVSLGGASALLASPLNVDAMVLESVFPDIEAAVHNRVSARLGILSYVPAELLLIQMKPRFGVSVDDLRPIDFVANAGCPVFVMSGSDDLHTTAIETERIYEAAVEPKQLWLVDGAAHVDLLVASPEDYRKRVLSFLNRHLGTGE